jgi:hypothetical protein
VRYDFSIPRYNSLNNLQETLHNHSGSNASTDDAEALENGSKRVDKEKNVQNNENLFMKKLVDLSGGFALITGVSY